MRLRMNCFLGKQTLALVRDGDYAHAGEEEAIVECFRPLSKGQDNRILDVGCGVGGTAAFVQTRGWGQVTGIDIDSETVAAAKRKYPDLCLVTCDVGEVSEKVQGTFDVIYSFNAFYAFPDQERALEQLRKVAEKGTQIMMFDYVDRRDEQDQHALSVSFSPLCLANLTRELGATGWGIECINSLDEEYERWYTQLVQNIAAKQDEIEALGGRDWFAFVRQHYMDLLKEIRAKRLGGAVVYAEAQ